MSLDSLRCPACGAPARMAPGQMIAVCEYCGTPIKQRLSDAELNHMAKSSEFTEAIAAAIQCIRNRDYKTAIEYAEKAIQLVHDDPAPLHIKYISMLATDYRKAVSFHNIALGLEGKKGESMSESTYKELLQVFAYNYFSDREADLKRMFATMKKVSAEDINNVRRYEYNKRMSDYFTDSELKTAFDSAATQEFDAFEQKVGRITQMDNANWSAVKDVRDKGLFRIGAVVMADPSYSGRASACVKKYQSVLNYKWESTFKNGSVEGSKDQIKRYRYECDSISNWIRTVR
ncbi:MAG: hypothetical protein IKQ14_02655 [Candidatus Methanomethylophilaceae archaeon]|nr:hypothetical protein [Candidatus Methanomethylophilaceae archaeon]MBR6214312.1 hypothetical protein [Candidatus Methanomethylophilaceae archaeon]